MHIKVVKDLSWITCTHASGMILADWKWVWAPRPTVLSLFICFKGPENSLRMMDSTLTHNVLSKLEQICLFHRRDLCICVFISSPLIGLRWVGLSLEKGDIAHFHAPIRFWQHLNQSLITAAGLFAPVIRPLSIRGDQSTLTQSWWSCVLLDFHTQICTICNIRKEWEYYKRDTIKATT